MSENPIQTIVRNEDGSVRTVVFRNGSKVEFRDIPVSLGSPSEKWGEGCLCRLPLAE